MNGRFGEVLWRETEKQLDSGNLAMIVDSRGSSSLDPASSRALLPSSHGRRIAFSSHGVCRCASAEGVSVT